MNDDLIAAVAEAIREARTPWGGGAVVREYDVTLARAAVAAVTAQGDVTDEQMIEAAAAADQAACPEQPCPFPSLHVNAATIQIKALAPLLAQQRAVDAARIAELVAERDRAYVDKSVEHAARMRAEATVERVRALADEWESDPAQGGYADALFAAARDLRAALAHPKENA